MVRRKFLKTLAGTMACVALETTRVAAGSESTSYKAVAFDAFPIFDPRPIFGLVRNLYPAQGDQFVNLWRSKIFEYTWLLASAGQYRDFWNCIDNALQFTARQLNIKLTTENHKRLMNAFISIQAYPDVKPALDTLKAAGLKLAFLSNMTDKMLHANIRNAGLEQYFDAIISTDRAGTFKPHPRAYQLGVDMLGVRRGEIVFAAFASWDAVGAKWFGYPTVWVNRLNVNAENLGLAPDMTGPDLLTLTQFVLPGRT